MWDARRPRTDEHGDRGAKVRGSKRVPACVELQREIWGEADLEVEPVTMFVVASITGGQVLGAFDGERLVGYTLALVGLRENRIYLHSHQTGVSSEYRDRGVGRMLKLFQREEALGRSIRWIEWTFDPLELKNAHFNLNRLGAICRRYIKDLYGVTTSPLHRGIPTDRLVAEWRLDSPRVIAAIGELAPVRAEAPAEILVPAGLEEWKVVRFRKSGQCPSTFAGGVLQLVFGEDTPRWECGRAQRVRRICWRRGAIFRSCGKKRSPSMQIKEIVLRELCE